MKHSKIYLLLFLATMLWGCQESDESFDNKAYFEKNVNNEVIYFKKGAPDQVKDLSIKIAKPALNAIQLNINVGDHLVSSYNMINNLDAGLLPQENFEILQNSVEIIAGAVKSGKATINFKNLEGLDSKATYILPIEISTNDIDVLESKSMYYYVFKGAALINDAANIYQNYLSINWKNADVCNNLTEVTMEALIRVKAYDRLISTVMGIEGQYLMRIGDAGYDPNQIQIATSGGNFPGADSKKGLPTGEWVHVALTHNAVDGSYAIYVDGEKQSEGTQNVGSSISLGSSGFHIGKSWDDNRYLNGDISEVRIWNKVRTPLEIAENPYYVDPNSEGLMAYWKFNDKHASIIKDHTVNGNDAEANSALTWVPVELPVNE